MKTVCLLFCCTISPLCLATEQKQALKEAPHVLNLSSGLQLFEVNEDIDHMIIQEKNQAVQKIAHEVSELRDLYKTYGNYLGIQGNSLDDLELNLKETAENIEDTLDLEEISAEEISFGESGEDTKPELVLTFEAQKELGLEDTLSLKSPSINNNNLKENGWAAGIGTASGLTALSIAYMAAAPVTVTATVTAGAIVLGAGGTKLHFNKDSLPSLPPLPSLPSMPSLSLPSFPKPPTWLPFIGNKDEPLPKSDKQ